MEPRRFTSGNSDNLWYMSLIFSINKIPAVYSTHLSMAIYVRRTWKLLFVFIFRWPLLLPGPTILFWNFRQVRGSIVKWSQMRHMGKNTNHQFLYSFLCCQLFLCHYSVQFVLCYLFSFWIPTIYNNNSVVAEWLNITILDSPHTCTKNYENKKICPL